MLLVVSMGHEVQSSNELFKLLCVSSDVFKETFVDVVLVIKLSYLVLGITYKSGVVIPVLACHLLEKVKLHLAVTGLRVLGSLG